MKTRLLITLLGVSLTSLRLEAGLVNLYILDTFTSPSNVSTTPFTFTSSDGYKLNLNGSGIATSTSALPFGGVSANIDAPLTYHSASSPIEQTESTSGFPNFAAYANSEIGRLDDVGFIQEGSIDAPLNLDFGNNISVLFNIPTGGLQQLLIAEDAGLDPFKLEHCTGININCSLLFNGWTTSGSGNVQSTLTSHDFGLNDTPSNIDQAFLFIFDAPLTGYFRVTETSNPDSSSTKLEIDFIGGVTAAPEPAFFGLLGLGMAGLFLAAKRKKPTEE